MTEPTQIAAGLIIREDRVLLTQRTGGRRYPFAWECPGGKVLPGEAPVAALFRELTEEIALRVSNPPWTYQREPVFTTTFDRAELEPEQEPFTISFYPLWPASWSCWRPVLADVEGCGWFTIAQMADLDALTPGNARLFDHLWQHGLPSKPK